MKEDKYICLKNYATFKIIYARKEKILNSERHEREQKDKFKRKSNNHHHSAVAVRRM